MLIIFRFHCVIYDLKLFSKAFIFGVNKGLLSKCLKEVYRLHKTQGLTQHYHKRQPVGGKAEGRHILVEVADQSTASSMAKVIQRMIWTAFFLPTHNILFWVPWQRKFGAACRSNILSVRSDRQPVHVLLWLILFSCSLLKVSPY